MNQIFSNQAMTDLELSIFEDKTAIEIKQLALSILKEEEKKNRPFSHTVFGNMLLRSAHFLTSGLATVHANLDRRLKSPFTFRSDQLVEKGNKLLNKATKLTRKEDEKAASKMALRLAEHVCTTEDFFNCHPDFKVVQEPILELMRSEVERLRPPRDKARFIGKQI